MGPIFPNFVFPWLNYLASQRVQLSRTCCDGNFLQLAAAAMTARKHLSLSLSLSLSQIFRRLVILLLHKEKLLLQLK